MPFFISPSLRRSGEQGWYTVAALPVRPSFQTKYFPHIFLRNYWCQPLDIFWCAVKPSVLYRASWFHAHLFPVYRIWLFFIISGHWLNFPSQFSQENPNEHHLIFCVQHQLEVLYLARNIVTLFSIYVLDVLAMCLRPFWTSCWPDIYFNLAMAGIFRWHWGGNQTMITGGKTF